MSLFHPNFDQRPTYLLAACREISQETDLNNVMARVIKAACELTGCETCFLMLFEEETCSLRLIATDPFHWTRLQHVRIPIENSLAGLCYQHQHTISIDNALSDSRVNQDISKALNITTRNLIAVPLTIRGHPLGVMEAINKKGRTCFSGEDAILLEMLAVQAATAFYNQQLDEQAALTEQKMQEIEKMKLDFIAIASHELRTPLSLILGHAALLVDFAPDPDISERAGEILEGADRLKDVVDALLLVEEELNRRHPLRMTQIDMAGLICEVVDSFQLEAKRKQIELATRLPDPPLLIKGDPDKLATALSNLVENAVTFTENNGHVQISAEQLPGYIKISLEDDGVGIPSQEVGRIFERFYQVDSHLTRRHSGLGIGLAVARSLIELHGGSIWVESVEGQGSNFSVLLPSPYP